MQLTRVRHAIAFERGPARWRDDASRPLTAQGERSFQRVARGFCQNSGSGWSVASSVGDEEHHDGLSALPVGSSTPTEAADSSWIPPILVR